MRSRIAELWAILYSGVVQNTEKSKKVKLERFLRGRLTLHALMIRKDYQNQNFMVSKV